MSRSESKIVPKADIFETGVKFLEDDNEAKKFANTYYGSVTEIEAGLKVNLANWVCHGQLSAMARSRLVFSRFKKAHNCSQTVADYYNNWLMSPISPWKLAIKLGMSMRDEVHFSGQYFREKGFIIDQPDKIPSNLMVSFLMATRVPNQWYQYAKLWYQMVHDHGADPAMAFLLSSCFSKAEKIKDRYYHSINDRGDWSVGCSILDDASLVRFFNGEPNQNRFEKSFTDNHNYWGQNGVTGIWYGDDRNKQHSIPVTDRWVNQLKTRYLTTIGKVELADGFSKKYTTWYVSPKELAEIANEEQKRLGLTRQQ